MKYKFIIAISLLLILNVSKVDCKKNITTKGTVSKVKDAATYGFGWQLGKEGAKEAIKGIKKAADSKPIKKLKSKVLDSKSEKINKNK